MSFTFLTTFLLIDIRHLLSVISTQLEAKTVSTVSSMVPNFNTFIRGVKTNVCSKIAVQNVKLMLTNSISKFNFQNQF